MVNLVMYLYVYMWLRERIQVKEAEAGYKEALGALRGCGDWITVRMSVGREWPQSGFESKAVGSTCKVKGERWKAKAGSKKRTWRVQVQRDRKTDGHGVK